VIALVAVFAALHAPASSPRALTLREATDIALSSDPGVQKARIDEERARLATVVANFERVHASVDASVEELYAGGSSTFFSSEKLGWQSGVLGLSNVQASVDVPIFSGFRVDSDIARAEDLEKASGFDLEAARQATALAVARAYWSERRLALLQEAQLSSAARLEDSERVVTARVNAGLAAGIDKNRAAARRAELDVEKRSLEAQRREADVRMQVALGMDEPVTLTDGLPTDLATVAVTAPDALVQIALDKKPELKAAELRGDAVDEEKRAAQSAFWPQLGAGALAQVGNNPAIAGAGTRAVVPSAIPFVGTGADLQAGLTLSVNLFDSYTTTHNIDDAAHRRRLADAQLRALRRDVESNVRLAHAKLASLVDQRKALDDARAIEADNTVILQKAYERGEVLLTELLDAQVRLADAERQIVDVDAQLALARIELSYATDGALSAEVSR
jgi:outer membrane protein TolC